VPTYQYACTECGERTEVVQKFSDNPLTDCAVCDGRLRKVFSPVGIVFKGSGFYRTDSRSSSKGKVLTGSDSGAASKNGSGESGSAGSDKKSGDSARPGTDAASSASDSSAAKSGEKAGSAAATPASGAKVA